MTAQGPIDGSSTTHRCFGQRCVVVVAAGSGQRLGRGMPKALVEIAGRTILEHSLEAIRASGVCGAGGRVVVTVPPEDHRLAELALRAGARPVAGGATRAESVRRALEVLAQGPEPEGVLIHDAARCLTPAAVFLRVAEALEHHPAVIPVLPVVDTMRSVDGDGRLRATVDRTGLRAIQTPQGFLWPLLRDVHAAALAAGLDDASITDDASLVERFTSHEVTAVPGDEESFKVTRPLDLLLAEAVLAHRDPPRPAASTPRPSEGHPL